MVSGGVVNDPDAPVMPLGEEEHETLLADDKVMTEVVLAAPYAITAGDADAYRVEPVGC